MKAEQYTLQELKSEKLKYDADTSNPVFAGGSFDITFLDTSQSGLEITTRGIAFRTGEGFTLNDEQKDMLRRATQGEMKFRGVSAVREAREAWNHARGTEDEAAARAHFMETRATYMNKGSKIGSRAIAFAPGSSNTLEVSVQKVPFPIYNTFSRPTNSPEILEWSAASGAAMIVRTADDRLVIQHRAVETRDLRAGTKSRGNASYTDIPGASVAGMVDASLTFSEDWTPGGVDAISTESIHGAILKEAGEELGIDSSDLDQLRIVGIAEDNIKPHTEYLLLADTKLTSEQLHETSRTSNRNKNLGDADFEEKFMSIECSPSAIATMLTEVKCPLPPTHSAALVAAGYALVLEQSSREAADTWREELQTAVQANARDIDERVSTYYQAFPEAANHIPERYWGKKVIPVRNLEGYDPAYSPDEQGLPTLERELVRTGLLPETRTPISEVQIYDVDGVLSDPVAKQAPEAIIKHLAAQLDRGAQVTLNTGRSTEWVEARIIIPLRGLIEDPSHLHNVLVVGEKGGAWTTYNEADNYTARHGASDAITVPSAVEEQVVALVAEKYSDIMYQSEQKDTMISIEMIDGGDIDTFRARQAELVADIQAILEAAGESEKYRIDPTTIATDIESPYVGKDLGARRLVQFLRSNDINADAATFTAFGDSPSDLAMADELVRNGLHAEMVYVGKESDTVPDHGRYPIRRVGGFTAGTLSYFNK